MPTSTPSSGSSTWRRRCGCSPAPAPGRSRRSPEIGLRTLTVSDGPVGVRGGTDTELEPSAALPSGSGMAATWDEELLGRIGRLLAGEAVRKGVDVVLGPTINLHRSPLGGRHFECFSEDPLLSGRLATAYVRGVQEQGIGACPKHYVANDAETDRFTVDNRVDERTLRELYLAPFEAVVTDADPWMVMAAYNAVNGAPMTENDLLAEPLKGEWGFDGVVVSDWGATLPRRAGRPRRARPDHARPGASSGASRWSRPCATGRVPEAAIDAKVRRILRLAARAGALDGVAPAGEKPAAGRIEDAAPLAREAAAAAAVLLRNDGILPLQADTLRRVAVIGPGAKDARALGGGSASVPLPYVVTPFAGLRAALDGRAEVVTAVGRDAVGLAARRPRRRAVRSRTSGSPVVLRWLDADGATVAEQPAGTATIIRLLDDRPRRRRGARGAHRLHPGRGRRLADRRDRARPLRAQRRRHDRARGDRGAGGLRRPPGVRVAAAALDVGARWRAGQRVDVRIRYRWPAERLHLPRRAGRRRRPPGRPTRSSPTPSSWPAPATSRSSSSAPARTSRARASTGRRWRCRAGRTSWSAPWRPPTRARSSSSTPVRPSSCRGATRCPPSWCPGSRAWSSATRWPTSCWAPSSPAAGCPRPGPRRWPTSPVLRGHAHRRAARVRRGPRHRAPRLPARRHRAGVLVRPRPRLHDLGVRVDRRVAPPATG